MAKLTDRKLMQQKINVNSALIQKWVDEYKFDIRHLITSSFMKESDLGTTFEHQGRTFEIVGMGNQRNIMLRETREEGVFYWETTREFVQMKLGRFNHEFKKLPNGKMIALEIPYETSRLLLAPKNAKRKKVEVVEEEFQDDENQEVLTDHFNDDAAFETPDY